MDLTEKEKKARDEHRRLREVIAGARDGLTREQMAGREARAKSHQEIPRDMPS